MWLAEFLETHKERCSHEGDQLINRGGNFPVFCGETGFEPAKPFRGLHAFQACLFNHSSISPRIR